MFLTSKPRLLAAAVAVAPSFTRAQAQDTTPHTVTPRRGEFKLERGFPTEETTKKTERDNDPENRRSHQNLNRRLVVIFRIWFVLFGKPNCGLPISVFTPE